MNFFPFDLQLFAKKVGGGKAGTNRNHDSESKRRGVKRADGEMVLSGNIIVRQLGTKFHVGDNAYLSRDYTIHAATDGKVRFYKKRFKHSWKTFVEIVKVV